MVVEIYQFVAFVWRDMIAIPSNPIRSIGFLLCRWETQKLCDEFTVSSSRESGAMAKNLANSNYCKRLK
jgi:hypothetical protein